MTKTKAENMDLSPYRPKGPVPREWFRVTRPTAVPRVVQAVGRAIVAGTRRSVKARNRPHSRRSADTNLPSLTLPSPPLFRCAGRGEGTVESADHPNRFNARTAHSNMHEGSLGMTPKTALTRTNKRAPDDPDCHRLPLRVGDLPLPAVDGKTRQGVKFQAPETLEPELFPHTTRQMLAACFVTIWGRYVSGAARAAQFSVVPDGSRRAAAKYAPCAYSGGKRRQ